MNITINFSLDAMQAVTSVLVSSGNLYLSSCGGNTNGEQKIHEQPGDMRGGFDNTNSADSLKNSSSDNSESDSKKGIKAVVDITIEGIESSIITVNGGSINIIAGDDSSTNGNPSKDEFSSFK